MDSTGVQMVRHPLPYKLCAHDEISQMTDEFRQKYYESDHENDHWYCIERGQDLDLWSSPSNSSSLKIEFIPCRGSHCYNETYREQKLESIMFGIAFISEQFDHMEYHVDWIKEKLALFRSSQLSHPQVVSLFLNQNVAIVNDEKIYNFLFGKAKSRKFISQTDWKFGVGDYTPGAIFTLTLGLDLQQTVFERSDYNLLQFLGDVGAFYSAVNFVNQFILDYVFRINF